jgi:ABC-2 type transport system ATP-binding protein
MIQTAPAIKVEGLTRKFKTTTALENLHLTVPRGCVFGLLGENGAGKTTLIKHLMGLYRPQTGTVRVLGGDPIADPENTLAQIGYLSEDRDIPRWMRVSELMQYTQGFYPKWDETYAQELLETFELIPSQKIKTLSLGQTAKTGLLVALAHRPELVVLDEPSSGLDAVVRRHILSSAIKQVAAEGRTVLFSSHLLDEVESVSDHIAIIDGGEVILCDALDTILKNHTEIKIELKEPASSPPKFASAVRIGGEGRYWTVLSNQASIEQEIASSGASINEKKTATLEEIFLGYVASHTPH